MTPSPPAARRSLLLGCGLATLTLLLPGCGEEGKAAPEGNSASQAPGEANRSAPPDAASGCPRQLSVFVKELRALRRQLAVGLSYEQYAAAVEDLRGGYDEIPVERIALDCLAAAGTPAEDALNKYIDGANAWGECLADAACTTATIEPVLQRKWRVASRYLSEAQ